LSKPLKRYQLLPILVKSRAAEIRGDLSMP
jgi:hypothetical protein